MFQLHKAHWFRDGAHAYCGKSAGPIDRMYPLAGFRALSGENASAHVCKCCLASLAKRDREFQRKARRAFPQAPHGTPRLGLDRRRPRHRARRRADAVSAASEAAIALVFNMRQLQRELDAAQARAYRRAASVIAGIILPDAYVPPVLRAREKPVGAREEGRAP